MRRYRVLAFLFALIWCVPLFAERVDGTRYYREERGCVSFYNGHSLRIYFWRGQEKYISTFRLADNAVVYGSVRAGRPVRVIYEYRGSSKRRRKIAHALYELSDDRYCREPPADRLRR